jgi:hypothetical protein
MEKLYRFEVDFGRHGKLKGVFPATPEEVAAAIGVKVFFEEPWGKHSGVEHTLEAKDFKVLTDDQDFIAKAKAYGIAWSGEHVTGKIADMRSDGRL